MEKSYYISVNSVMCKKTIYAENLTIDEAVSFGITLFDKFATRPLDNVIIFKKVSDPVRAVPVRLIELKEGNKINVEAY